MIEIEMHEELMSRATSEQGDPKPGLDGRINNNTRTQGWLKTGVIPQD